jgi:ankyrin repeat domain-containing protein 17
MIELLLQYNADVNASNQTTGLTPLMYAIRNRHLQSVQLLLQNGADISAKDLNQKSALIHAASSNSTEIFALIFDTDWQSEEEQSVVVRQAFHEAIQSGNIHLCKYILDTTDISIDLSTSLMVACCSGSVNAVQFLLSKGATLKVDQKWDGKPALLCVVQSGLFELTNTLLNTPNLKINTEVSSQGYTPLIIAAKYGHVGLIELLLNKGILLKGGILIYFFRLVYRCSRFRGLNCYSSFYYKRAFFNCFFIDKKRLQCRDDR